MERAPVSRGVEVATAVALGLVSLVTALGVLQAGLWTADAGRFGDDASDARDQSIALSVSAQLQERADIGKMAQAALIVQRQDEAFAAADYDRVLELSSELSHVLSNTSVDLERFEEWREAGFPADGDPARSPEYAVANRGHADALMLTSLRLGSVASDLGERAGVFGQASLVHALALFLFGVAGINRLRMARYVTLALGVGVFLFALFLMSTAY